MKSMLILTDFSEEAFRAAEYACELAAPLHIERIVLFHAYQPVMAVAGTIPPAVPITSDQELYLESMESLGLLQDRLKPMVKHDVTIDMVAEETTLGDLADVINQRSQKEEIDLIVMGVSNKSGLEKFLTGGTTAKMLKAGEWPVLVVPENALLGRAIKTIVFTTDLKDVDTTIPAHKLYDFLDALPGKLQVINVQKEPAEKKSPETEKAITDLHKLLDKYDPAFNYVTGDNTVEEILAFAAHQHASLIVAVHQKHGFLSRLFHESTTKKLAYNSSIPLLSLPGLG